jgi:hypothetical protein
MGVIWRPFTSDIAGNAIHKENFKHPTEDKTYRRLSLLTNEVELIRNSKNTVRAQAFWLMNSERLDAATEHLEAALLGFQLP